METTKGDMKMKNNERKAELTPEENKTSVLPEDALE